MEGKEGMGGALMLMCCPDGALASRWPLCRQLRSPPSWLTQRTSCWCGPDCLPPPFLLLPAPSSRLAVKGWGNLQAARQCRAILVFNHDSYVDAVSTIVILEGSSVAKSGVARIPLVGRVCVALQLVFVQRRNSRDPKLGEQLAPDVDPVEVGEASVGLSGWVGGLGWQAAGRLVGCWGQCRCAG